MRTFRFRALVSLNADGPDIPASDYPSGPHMVLVQASLPGQPDGYRDFRAALCRDDKRPLQAGESAVVTLTLAGGEADSYLRPGQHFTLWSGGDIGHGVVSRRVFVSSGPC